MTTSGGYAGASVLVTGAQGFIGSWLTERLLEQGARVAVPRRAAAAESRFRREGLEERCDLLEFDLLDLTALVRALNEHQVGTVFHLAAQTTVGAASRSPFSSFEVNVRGTYTLLEACRLLATDVRVVVASSSYAYGRHPDSHLSEEVPLRSNQPYDVSKACADMIARCYAATYDMPVAVTRLANVYGGGDLNFSRLVPAAARALVSGQRPVIHSDGTPERDYVYVEDAVDAYLAVAESLARPALCGMAWNVGGDAPVSMAGIVQRLIRAAGRELEPEIRRRPTPGDETDRRHLDSAALRERLGWKPKWTLDDGLRATYNWYERNHVPA